MSVLVFQVVIEERKEADRTIGQATHRISRGIHDKVIIPLVVLIDFLGNN